MLTKGTALLRQQNEKKALAFLRYRKNATRQEVAKALKVSKNTVSLIIDKFIKDGVVKETRTTRSGVGRRECYWRWFLMPIMRLEFIYRYQSASMW